MFKEELKREGLEGISDAYLLAELTGAKVDVIEELLVSYRSAYMLSLNVDCHKDLFTPRQREKIKYLGEMLNRGRSYMKSDRVKISSPREIASNFLSDIKNKEQEVMCVLLLNTKNQLIKRVDVSKGTVNMAISHPRDILKEVIRYNAYSFVIAHNHPSGDPTPSQDDIKLTERVNEVSKILGIPLLDSIIVANEGVVSLRQEGVF